ncbi:hypothetical protein [Kitasatospora cinereorecta]|uniref:Uncharacterized protein n=1 Tax=Kitasatospora cinereorecta TaxID=285560 RepID=A0ABW0VGS2_9ACTN
MANGSFPSHFDGSISFGPQEQLRGYFGRDVLKGLVSGIDDFLAVGQRYGSRSLGPALLGGFMWLDDQELLDRISAFPAACVVITKQQRGKYQQARIDKLKLLAEQGPGFPARALPELADMYFREDGQPPVVGPGSHLPSPRIPTLRTIGYRKAGNELVPILHTKMVLLGELWWHDEDPLGGAADVIGFRPQRLWLGSANGTTSSRSNLEFGLWLDDTALLREAKRFLAEVIRHSEILDPDSSHFEPELTEPNYDDDAFAEYLGRRFRDEGESPC